LVYAAIAVLVAVMMLLAERGVPGTGLRAYLIEQPHPIGPWTFVALIGVGAIASMLRASMRGVRVRGDSLEYRDVVSFAWPRVRRYRWAQIDRILLDAEQSLALDLWDGTRAFLPSVGDHRGLSAVLEKVGAARAIPVRGGVGLDEIPDSTEFDDD
jgi:hypothetical protein